MPQRNVGAPEERTCIGVLNLVEIVDTHSCVAHRYRGIVERKERTIVAKTDTHSHISPRRIGNHRTNTHSVALRVDIVDKRKGIILVAMGRVRGSTAKYPLTLRHKAVVGRESTLLASLIGAKAHGCNSRSIGNCTYFTHHLLRRKHSNRERGEQ